MNYKYNERKQCWLTWPKVILLGILLGLIGTIIAVLFLSSVEAELRLEQGAKTQHSKPGELKVADSGSQPYDLQPTTSHWALHRTYNVQDNQ